MHFGRIRLALIDLPGGDLIVLDSGRDRVWRFSQEGSPVVDTRDELIANPDLNKLTISSTGTLVALAGYSQLRFLPPGGSRPNETVTVPPLATDICSLDKNVYVHGWADADHVITVFSDRGERLTGFGAAYRSETPLVSKRLSVGTLACNQHSKTIVAMFQSLPYVYGYSPTGMLRWVTKLGAYRPPTATQLGRGLDAKLGLRPAEPPNKLLRLVSTRGSALMIQIMDTSDAGPVVRSYLIDSASGQGGYIGTNLPEVLDVQWPMFLSATSGEKPVVRLYAARSTERGNW